MSDRRKSGEAARKTTATLKRTLDKKARQAAFETRFWSKVARAGPDDCWPWLGKPDTCSIGYGRITRDGKKLYAHRVSYELANGGMPKRAYVQHRCDNPACCQPRHLKVGLPFDNTRDMIEKNRRRDRLKRSQVLEIDRLARTDAHWTIASLALKFERSETSIRRILAGATWSKVTGRKTKPRSKSKAAAISAIPTIPKMEAAHVG